LIFLYLATFYANDTPSNLTSPNFPNEYPLIIELWWNIRAPLEQFILFTFLSGNIEEGYDEVSVSKQLHIIR